MFTYEKLVTGLSGLEFYSAGKSTWGRELYYYKVGRGEKKLFINGVHHGNEDITGKVALDFYHYIKDKCMGWEIYVMPMVNPDSAVIAQGLIPTNTETFERIRKQNGWRNPISSWTKNAGGVDINHNYDADFTGDFYGGRYPESEPETRAVVNLVREKKFNMVICLHSQGEVIYHGFKGIYPKGSREIAEAMAHVSGYRIEEPCGSALSGGMKDWFCDKFSRPGFTIEVGRGKNPIDESQTEEIEKRVFPAIYKGMLTYCEVLC